MPTLSPVSLPNAVRKVGRRTLSLRFLLTTVFVLPLAACDGSPSKADLTKVVANQARAANPLMRGFDDDVVLKGAEVTAKTCQAASGGTYRCSVTVEMMGQTKVLTGVFAKRNGEWSEMGVM